MVFQERLTCHCSFETFLSEVLSEYHIFEIMFPLLLIIAVFVLA